MESKKINQLATELAPALSDLTIIGDPTTGISKKITLSQMASLFTGTVEEYANVAAFPLVGAADTIYIALDTNVLYRWDTGTNAYVELSPNIINSLVFNDANGFDGTINLVGSVATLTITTALTTGSVGFIGASGALTQDNDNFYWDNSNKRLGIGTKLPTTAIDVFGSGIIGRLNGTSTNNAFLGFASAGTNKWSIGNVQSNHRFRIYSEANTSELVSVLQTGEFGIGIANPTTKLHIDGGASALIANLDANVSIAKSISFRSDNSARINLEVSGTESGSNAGANFFLRTYTDAGSLLATPFTITRSTGNIGIGGNAGNNKLTVTGSFRTDLGTAGTSAVFTGTGSNLQINHDGTSAVTLVNTGGAGYIFKAANTTTTIFSLSNAGAGIFLSTLTATSITTSAYSYLYGLRISGNDVTNTIYSGSANMGITADSGYNIFIGQANAATTGLSISTTTGNAVFSNNLGIGNQSNLYSGLSGIYALQNGNSSYYSYDQEAGIIGNAYYASGWKYKNSNLATRYISNIGTHTFQYATTGTANAALTWNTGLYISNTGNVGIQNTSPDVSLLIGNTTTLTATANPTTLALDNSYFNGTTSGDKLKLYILRGGVNIGFGAGNIGDFNIWCDGLTRFYNGGYERVRITGDGQVMINRTATGGQSGKLQIETTGTDAIYIKQSAPGGYGFAMSAYYNAGTYYYMYFQAGVTDVGSITSNGTTTTYATSSDYRIKEDLKDFNALNKISKIKIYDFKFKNSKDRMNGVIAHELQEIIPYAVTGQKDDEKMQGVDYSLLTPINTKSIQELYKLVLEQQAQIEELKLK